MKQELDKAEMEGKFQCPKCSSGLGATVGEVLDVRVESGWFQLFIYRKQK